MHQEFLFRILCQYVHFQLYFHFSLLFLLDGGADKVRKFWPVGPVADLRLPVELEKSLFICILCINFLWIFYFKLTGSFGQLRIAWFPAELEKSDRSSQSKNHRTTHTSSGKRNGGQMFCINSINSFKARATCCGSVHTSMHANRTFKTSCKDVFSLTCLLLFGNIRWYPQSCGVLLGLDALLKAVQ